MPADVPDGNMCSRLRNRLEISPVASNAVDVAVFAVYFVLLAIIGIVSSFKNRGSLSGYFLASRNANWMLVGSTLFASNIGSGHFVGLAGASTASGIGVAGFQLHAMFMLPLLGWVFAPVYLSAGVYTLPEYLQLRFGGRRIQIYQSCLSLALYIFTKISADLYSATIFIETSLGLNKYVAIVILLVISATFTITGGMTAVIWTDFGQVVIMLVGAFILLGYCLVSVGGFDGLTIGYMEAEPDNSYWLDGNTTYWSKPPNEIKAIIECGKPLSDSFHLIRDADDANYPWPGIAFGLTVMALWYWCTDQVMVQRVLASRNLAHAKLGTVLACFYVGIPLLIMVIPGMAARVLYTDYVACSDPDKCQCYCGSRGGCSNHSYTLLVTHLLPIGLRGVMLAVMVAALVSSLTSIFNSSATIFTMDLWRLFRKNASQVELMIVGRLFIVVLVVFSIVWMVVVSNASQLFHYIQKVTAYLCPPITAIFILAVFYRRINEIGAFSGLMTGLLTGVIRFVIEFAFTEVPCADALIGRDTRPTVISHVHYFYFALICFFITACVAVVVSLFTKPPEKARVDGLTYWDRHLPVRKDELIDADESGKIKGGTENFPYIAFFDRLPFWLRIAAAWICGVEHSTNVESANKQTVAVSKKDHHHYEPPLMGFIAKIALILTLAAALFIWAVLW